MTALPPVFPFFGRMAFFLREVRGKLLHRTGSAVPLFEFKAKGCRIWSCGPIAGRPGGSDSAPLTVRPVTLSCGSRQWSLCELCTLSPCPRCLLGSNPVCLSFALPLRSLPRPHNSIPLYETLPRPMTTLALACLYNSNGSWLTGALVIKEKQ